MYVSETTATPARLQERLLDLGPVGERVHHDVERLLSEILAHPRGHAGDGRVAHVLVPFVLADRLRHVLLRIERRVQRVDLLEREQRAVGQPARFVDLPALQQVLEDVERIARIKPVWVMEVDGRSVTDPPAIALGDSHFDSANERRRLTGN